MTCLMGECLQTHGVPGQGMPPGICRSEWVNVFQVNSVKSLSSLLRGLPIHLDSKGPVK